MTAVEPLMRSDVPEPVMDAGWWKLKADGGWFTTDGKDGSLLTGEGREAWMRCMLEEVRRQGRRLES